MINLDYFDSNLVKKLDNEKVFISEDQRRNQKFIMNLDIMFEDCQSVYQLVENGDEKTKIKFLSLKQFPDGVFIKEVNENEYEIVVIELKKTATSHLRKIPKQLHSGILNAVSLLNLSVIGFPNNSPQIQQKEINIRYKLYVGAVEHGETKSVGKGLTAPKFIPGRILESSNEKQLYDNNKVSYKDKGKTIEFCIEKLRFIENSLNYTDYENYICEAII